VGKTKWGWEEVWNSDRRGDRSKWAPPCSSYNQLKRSNQFKRTQQPWLHSTRNVSNATEMFILKW
jgi:hypothetical protein